MSATPSRFVIDRVRPGTSAHTEGFTYSVTCQECEEKSFSDSLGMLDVWKKEHACVEAED